MKKIIFLRIVLILSIFFIIFSGMQVVNASSPETGDSLWTEMENDTNSFLSTGKTNAGNIQIGNVTKPFVNLAQILTTIGAGVMVAVTTYMGIKYLTAGPEAQAKLKIQLIGVVVAGIVIFGAYNIWKIVINFSSSL